MQVFLHLGPIFAFATFHLVRTSLLFVCENHRLHLLIQKSPGTHQDLFYQSYLYRMRLQL
jgi:hypothetical protein